MWWDANRPILKIGNLARTESGRGQIGRASEVVAMDAAVHRSGRNVRTITAVAFHDM